MRHQGRTDSISSLLWRTRLRLLPLLALVLLLSVMSPPDSAQAADQLRFHSVKGEWAVTSGVAADDIGRTLARGVPKRYIRYSIEDADGFSIGRRSGRVSYDGTPISAGQVSLTVTARDKNGEAASATRVLEVSVTHPPEAPSGFTVRATRFNILGKVAGAHLSWDNPNNAAITGWELWVTPALRDWPYKTWTPIPGSGPETTSHVVSGLRPLFDQEFKLRAVVGEVKGAESPKLTFDISRRPTGLTATPILGGVTLRWDDAESHAGIDITGWETRWAVVGWTPWEAVSGHTVSDGVVSFTIDHNSDGRLNPYGEFKTYFSVRAVYANGQRGAPVGVSATPIPIPRPPAETD